MQIFVEWWSGKTIKLEVAACYTIDTVKAKILAQEGTPLDEQRLIWFGETLEGGRTLAEHNINCLLYTSPSPRDATLSRMPSSA